MKQRKRRAEERKAQVDEREQRAEDWRMFRKSNMLTQQRLAEVLGISRRTVQQIEGAHLIPSANTQRLFAVFRAKYDGNASVLEI